MEGQVNKVVTVGECEEMSVLVYLRMVEAVVSAYPLCPLVGTDILTIPSLSLFFHVADDEDEWDRRDRERSERKRERKEKRTRDELVLDEIAPKETGREAQLAKKRAQNAYHKRERSPDVELNESDLYGDDRSR